MPSGKLIWQQSTLKYFDNDNQKFRWVLSNYNYEDIVSRLDSLERKGVSGGYTGNADDMRSNQQNINIGFRPSYVFACVGSVSPITDNEAYFSVAANNVNNAVLGFTNTGFYVNNRSINGKSMWLNMKNYAYTYICM